jgi:regulatory protein SWI5
VQDTQQQQPSVAQPGYQPPPQPDFSSHLQQQLHGSPVGDFKPVIVAPQPANHQQAALQELQHHMEWYRNTYGNSPTPNITATNAMVDMSQTAGAIDMTGAPMHGMPMIPMQPMPAMPQTPVSQGHARTVPNTPQTYTQAWPSPPPTNVKHARSQSFQLDVAPMPDSVNGNALVAGSFGNINMNHPQASFTTDNGYASSAYSSSQVDPLSPRPIHPPGPMPTLFEEPTPPLNGAAPLDGLNESNLLLQATAGAQDFNDPDFDFGGPIGMSPRAQMMNNLGLDMPASIVVTGIPAYEVQRFIGELSDVDNKYPCLYEGCDRRFGRKENVRAHIQTHLGDRQFKCDLCNKTFVRQHDLKRHVAIHSDQRPFVCPCNSSFARHDALTRHRQRGMCSGALPGFEKTEEEKPKRGRPKKERPDLEARTDKAAKQRKKNKAKETEAAAEASGDHDVEEPEVQIIYASSSSGASERSFPVTPPDTSDAFDADAFLNMANGDVQFDSVTSTWKDTPPTSPVSFHGGSSEPDIDFFSDDVINSQPGVGLNAFSPPGESNSSQSVYTDAGGKWDVLEISMMGKEVNASFGNLGLPPTDILGGSLEDWLNTH